MKEKISTSIIILIIFLFLLLIGSIIWIILAKKSLDECRNTESNNCPYYYCENNKNIGSPCVNELKTTQKDTNGNTITTLGPNVGFRYSKDKNGNSKLMCQTYTLSNNAYSTWEG